MFVPGRYWRSTWNSPAGAICQRPPFAGSSSAANIGGLSKRGQHSQSSEPFRPISAAARQSPMMP
jgi:hypothetical protein